MIQVTEEANRENQRMAVRLEGANQQLQAYADQAVALAAERERFRLARDLHNSVTQTIFSMNLTVQTARLLMEKDPSRVSAQLERLLELAQSAMHEIHTPGDTAQTWISRENGVGRKAEPAIF